MNPVPPSSAEVKAVAADWVVRRQGGLDAAAEREFARWHDAAPEHAEAFRRLDGMSGVFQRARLHGTTPALVTRLVVRARRRTRHRLLAATSALVLLGAGLWSWSALSPGGLEGGASAVARVFEPLRRLPDGSLVELKPGAVIAVKFEAGKRRVELVRGEALFRVEPDATRPFIVSAAGVEAHAVGTSFNVRLDPSAVSVLVTEGKVRVEDVFRPPAAPVAAERASPPLLTAGQQVIVDRAAASLAPHVTTLSAEEIRRLLAWRVPRFEFDGVELVHAVQAYNRVNRIQLAVADDQVGRLRISGDFAQDDPATFARLASATFGLKLNQDHSDRLLLGRE